MSGDFLGIYENSVNKMRVIIPAPMKCKIETTPEQTVICSIGEKNMCVAVIPIDTWNEYKTKAKSGDERASRFYSSLKQFAMPEQQLEGPGRVRIGDELIKITGITDNVIIKGEGDYITIWNPDVFKVVREEKLKNHAKEFDAIDYEL